MRIAINAAGYTRLVIDPRKLLSTLLRSDSGDDLRSLRIEIRQESSWNDCGSPITLSCTMNHGMIAEVRLH